MDLNNGENNGWLETWRTRARTSLEQYRGAGLRVLFGNFMSLSVLQAANYLLPLIVLPYLVRVIGIEKFGLIVFAQAVIQYFNVVTDFGFQLSATRDIAVHRNDSQKISTIFSAVFIIKSILAALCFGVLIILVVMFDKFGSEAEVYLLTFGVVIGNLLFPVWLFQGIERMKYITALTVLGRVIYIILLFIFVHQESDYVTVPLVNSIGMIAAGLVSTFVALYKFKVRLYAPALSDLVEQFKNSSQYFLSRVSVSIYSSFNTVILGFFTTNEAVGLYAAAEKLFIAMRTAFNPLVQALYPYMAARSNVSLFKKVFYLSVGASALLAAIVFLLSDFIIETIFGTGFKLSAELLRLFALVVPFVMASVLLGYPFLAALGREKYANFSIAIGSVVHLLLIALLIPIISPTAVAAAMIVTQLVVLVIRIHGVRKHKLWQIP